MPEDVDIEQIKALVKLVQEHHLAELTVEENGVTITVKGSATDTQSIIVQPLQAVPHEQQTPTAPAPLTPKEEQPSNLIKIESPMVGVFYRAPSPDSPPFVEVGDVIEVGQTIGLIEAMKVFSEIPSDVAGEVVDIPAENGKLVQQGQTIVVIRP